MTIFPDLIFHVCYLHYREGNGNPLQARVLEWIAIAFSVVKVMAIHSSTLAWKIPWTEEPGRLQSMGSQRVRHDWVTSLSLFTFMHWRRKWQPTPVFLPGESQGWGSLVGCRLWGRTELDTTERLHFHFSLLHIGEGNGNPLQCSCLENPRDGRAWWAAIYGVAKSQTWLKRLSRLSSMNLKWYISIFAKQKSAIFEI